MTDAAPSGGTAPEPSGPTGHPGPDLRASDADRERVADILREALAEGRLDMEEFQERLDATYRAKTYGELVPVTRDLPTGNVPAVSLTKDAVPRGDWDARITGREGSSWGVAVMSGFSRRGRWTVSRRFTGVAFWGGGEIDLREADFADRVVEITCVAIMGGLQVIVPPGVEVDVRGIGVMGGFDESGDVVPSEPGAPKVIVNGFAFWGGVSVERKPTRAELKRQREERKRLRQQRRRGELESG
jgi:hypothetical protein